MSPAELLIAFFFFVLAAVSAAGYVFVLRPSQTESEAVHLPAVLDREVSDISDLPTAQAAVLDVFRMIGQAIPGPAAQAETARTLLLAAGYRWPSAVSVFLGIKIGFALMLATACVWGTMLSRNTLGDTLVPAICGFGIGYILPNSILTRLAKARSERLRKALPAALDLMVLAVEAGQGLDAAILETSRGLRFTHPDLASEFTQLQLELRADTSRVEALRNFSTRSQDSELRKFANLLIETDRFGSSLGPALRTHAKYLRTRFRQSAQERARKVSVKLIFPIFFLIFPSVILVTLGPAVILVMGQLKNMFGE